MTGRDQRSASTATRDPWFRVGLVAALFALGVVFIHVPAALWAGNASEFQSAFPWLLLSGLTAVLTGLGLAAGVLWLLPRLRRALASLFCALGLVWWIYAFFLTGRMNVLNGQQAPMDFDTRLGVWELPLAAAVCLGIAAALARWRRLAGLIAVWLNLGLTVATAVTVASAARGSASHTLAPAADRLLRFSPQGNVLIVLLDALQSDVADKVLRGDDALREAFDGFQFYKDAVSPAPTTFLSLPAIHSGEVYEGAGSLSTYFTRSIEHRSFLSRFADAGYDATLVNPLLDICPDHVSTCMNAAAILRSPSRQLMHESLRLLDLSLFRISPPWLKRQIYNKGNWFTVRLVTHPTEIDRMLEGNAFVQALGRRLVVSAGPPTIKFLHLFSTHPPLVLNDDCRTVVPEHSVSHFAPQARCALSAVATLFENMKRTGIYDESVILVLADHGLGVTNGYLQKPNLSPQDWAALAGAANPVFMLKPRGRHGALQEAAAPVHLTDVGATLCGLSQACTMPHGISAGEASPDRHRRFNFYAWKQEYWDAPEIPNITAYEVAGPLWNQESWSKSGPVAPYRLGDAITFGTSGTSDPYLQFGWGGAEGWGRWTASDVAQLRLHVTNPVDGALELVARISPFIPPSAAGQTVTWSANDQVIGTWTFASAELSERRLRIPRAVLGDRQDLRLALHIASPVSPMDVGISNDPRPLGLAFSDLRLVASPGEVQQHQER